ncbi:MAG: hypothetical protein E6J91_20290 [Deltaproteobacteria bacterium]|nr:MAG: hypothetical protein E6J91_20290 [Deltaproteobacteria bacterium]
MTTPSSPTERVGRYQLLEPIGIGPSGAVSRAKVFGVAGFERQFAVKRFHTELTATAAMAAMLSAAARAYGSLEHPRIARMSEFGVAQGSTFTAVEYVPGLDALRLISEARLAGVTLAAGGALALVSQAARAVGYAHGRGLAHLGLAPTNVIVTADGDIKITDFGILSATLPPRPIEVPRLAQRIPYLAPEQLANEQATAATDVFALGVLAYELVTGTRTFRGDTPQQVASAIMAGPPSEPALPRPIVRVLQRCLARSPFERFPDGRALADALDAALRVAPVPGTRKDIGVQVKDTLDRLAALNEGQMSGMVALHLGTGPVRRLDEDDIRRPATAREPEVAPDPSVAAPYEIGPADPLGPAGTMPDLPRPITTVPGLPPPPIPVPSGLAGPGNPPPSGPSGAGTLLGLGRATPPAIPTIKPRAGSVSGIPPVPPAARRAQTRPGADFAIPIEPVAPTPLRDASTESAVHPLDPSDLESVDPASLDETVAEPYRPATDDAADGDAGEPVSGPTVSLGPRAADPSMAPPAADDFQDAPTHALTAAAVAEGRRAARYRLDPSSIETKPIPPVTLEPLLFDPIDPTGEDPRPAGRAVGGPTPRDRAAPIDPPTELPLERSLERPTERTLDRAAERARAIATDPPTERTLERPDDRLARATDAPGEPTARSFGRQQLVRRVREPGSHHARARGPRTRPHSGPGRRRALRRRTRLRPRRQPGRHRALRRRTRLRPRAVRAETEPDPPGLPGDRASPADAVPPASRGPSRAPAARSAVGDDARRIPPRTHPAGARAADAVP